MQYQSFDEGWGNKLYVVVHELTDKILRSNVKMSVGKDRAYRGIT
jgi:hypothetical protein